jgi:erythronate-4-phosphate dehydrogenase
LLQIIADENIPFATEYFASYGDLRLIAGRDITPDVVHDADVLLVRSVTKVNEALLKHSNIRFVATATAGCDHIDTQYLQEHNIGFASAPASNAESVEEYILVALLALAVQKKTRLRGKTVGVVGYGNIGSRLAPRLKALGMNVLVNDPLLFVSMPDEDSAPSDKSHDLPFSTCSLEVLLSHSDIVTFHVPLTKSGQYPTWHLLNKGNMSLVKDNVWLLNASRGGVIEEEALEVYCAKVGALVLDVWEREPLVSPSICNLADIATPHIAGYSYDGKLLGTKMIYEAFCAFFGLEATALESNLAETSPKLEAPNTTDEEAFLHALGCQMYDLSLDDAAFRPISHLSQDEQPVFFHHLRKHYPKRFSFSRFRLLSEAVPEAWREAVNQGLGIGVENEAELSK